MTANFGRTESVSDFQTQLLSVYRITNCRVGFSFYISRCPSNLFKANQMIKWHWFNYKRPTWQWLTIQLNDFHSACQIQPLNSNARQCRMRFSNRVDWRMTLMMRVSCDDILSNRIGFCLFPSDCHESNSYSTETVPESLQILKSLWKNAALFFSLLIFFQSWFIVLFAYFFEKLFNRSRPTILNSILILEWY